jgi:hypothetical protein
VETNSVTSWHIPGWKPVRSALCDYLLAQTYDDPKDPERVKLLKQAGRGFDAIFQEYRGRQISLLAHMWHGKTLEELGDTAAALDVYDEVLVVSPEGTEADPELAPLFGQAELFRLRLQAKTAQPREIIEEGERWLQAHKRWQPTSPYQGIALEVAWARVRAAEKMRAGAERTKLMRDCVVLLSAIGKVDSEHRHSALLLRRRRPDGSRPSIARARRPRDRLGAPGPSERPIQAFSHRLAGAGPGSMETISDHQKGARCREAGHGNRQAARGSGHET